MDVATRSLKQKFPQLKDTEIIAIHNYTRGDISDFRHLNNQLRKRNLNDFNVAFSKLLSTSISKLPAKETTVYRTIRLNKTNLNNWIENAEQQGTITFDAFTSTSTDKNVIIDMINRKSKRRNTNETDILIIIHGKEGHDIQKISAFPEQKEILFDKGKQFKILSCKKIDGCNFGYEFELEEL